MVSTLVNTGTGHKIKENCLEDLEVLSKIEKILKFRRGYIFSLPKENTDVVACVSGGLDSIINTAVLLEDFHYNVYPFFINRGQSNYKWEKKSMDFFNKYFKERYPAFYHDYIEISIDTPAIAYKNNLRDVKNLRDNPFLRQSTAYPARNPIIALVAMEYAYSLQANGVFPKTIFATHTADDPVLHSTLTVLRTDNLLMCEITSDYNWQFTSLPLECELDNYYGKAQLVKWANDNDIPIEKTRSCYKNGPIHCGECSPACVNRKKAFLDAGVIDKTKYLK